MEITIKKRPQWGDVLILEELGLDGRGAKPLNFSRLNSAMTKDLIKQEMMLRVLSFRPTKLGIFKMTAHAWHRRATYNPCLKFRGLLKENPNRRKLSDYI